MTSSHGTGCAGLSSGKNFGLAFKSNIWNMSAIASPTSMGIEASYDIMKIFHQNKPVTAGRKNPTVVNGSWGYFAGFNSNTQVYYSFKGSTGNFTDIIQVNPSLASSPVILLEFLVFLFT